MIRKATKTTKPALTPAVAYIRMSSNQQDASPEQQRAEINKLAGREGYSVIRWYEDPGVSGDDTRKRKAFLRMLKDADDKKWTKVNPVGILQPGTPEKYVKYNIAEFIKSGGIVLACNLAFGDVVARFTKEDKLSKEDGRKRALARHGLNAAHAGGDAGLTHDAK